MNRATGFSDDPGPVMTRHTTFTLHTTGQGLYEFTRDVTAWAQGTGLLTLFVQHTSCSLLVQENADPEVQADLKAFFKRLVPPTTHPSMAYLTHTYEGPDDMPAHIKAALLPVSLHIPVTNGTLALGTWQGIYLFEHRDAPKTRHVAAHLA
jgi:secondary thiamine-phosphate synthase enzyme